MIADHRRYSANTDSKASITTSFLRCWSEVSKLFAVCPSQTRSAGILLAVDDPTSRSTAAVPKAPATTELLRLLACGPGDDACRSHAAGGVTAVAEDRTSESPTESETAPGVAILPEAETSAAVGANNTRLEGTGVLVIGTAVVAIMSPIVAANAPSDTRVVSLDPALADGSKMTVPPAPIVRLPPSRRALASVIRSVPAETVVPPV